MIIAKREELFRLVTDGRSAFRFITVTRAAPTHSLHRGDYYLVSVSRYTSLPEAEY